MPSPKPAQAPTCKRPSWASPLFSATHVWPSGRSRRRERCTPSPQPPSAAVAEPSHRLTTVSSPSTIPQASGQPGRSHAYREASWFSLLTLLYSTRIILQLPPEHPFPPSNNSSPTLLASTTVCTRYTRAPTRCIYACVIVRIKLVIFAAASDHGHTSFASL